MVQEPDPFENAETVPGLEHLGRAIVDGQGQPSGSPANYEATRGKSHEPLPPAEDVIEAIKAQLGGLTDA